MIRQLFTALLVLCALPSFAQIRAQFVPELSGRTIDGLFSVRIMNITGSRQTGSLTITVSERSGGTVVQIKTNFFYINPGNNSLPPGTIREAGIRFSQTAAGNFARQNNFLAQGNYEYCFTVTPAPESQLTPTEQCYSYELVPFAPFNLTQPYNRDQICEKKPVFTWQPSVPMLAGTNYQLLLAEVKEGQNATEALHYNLPLVSQQGIYAPVLPYPSISRELTEGKTYAWQVTAYKDRTVINRSEVWQFTVSCKDEVFSAEKADYGYRDLEDLVKGNYYLAANTLKFTVMNAYLEQKLQYNITCITDPSVRVKKLPKVTLRRGKNKIDLDFSRNSSIKDGYTYVMHVTMPDGTGRDLRFVYKKSYE